MAEGLSLPIAIIIVGYIMSFAILGGQEILGDMMGIDMMAFDPLTGGFTGNTLKNEIASMTDTFSGCYDSNQILIGGFANQTYTDTTECFYADATYQPTEWIQGTNSSYSGMAYQTAQMQLTMASEPSVTNNPITSAAEITYQLFQVLTGTYVFNILMFMGVPQIYVVGITMVYVLTLAVWVIRLLSPSG